MTGVTESGEHLFIQGVPALVSTAEAVVGRPLTPVSVAGVAVVPPAETRATSASITARP